MAILATISGAISMFVMFLGYIVKKRTSYLTAQMIANFFYGLQFMLLGGYSAGCAALVGIGKNIWFYYYEKKNLKPSIIALVVLESIYITIGVLTFDGLVSLIPIFLSCTYAWAGWQTNLQITRIVGFLASILWVFYDIQVGAYISIFASAIEALACTIGFIKKARAKDN